MLPRARFGDDPVLFHPASEDGLSNGIVDLMGAGMTQVFPLQENFGSTEDFREASGEIERSGASDILYCFRHCRTSA